MSAAAPKESKLRLPENLYWPEQLLAVAEELHGYAEALGQTRRRQKVTAKTTPAAPLPELSPDAAAALELLPAAEQADDRAVEGLRHSLEQLATAAPTLTVVLAAIASHSLRHEMVTWLRANVHPDLLVIFHVNPEIAGGVVLRGRSHVYDSSWRTALLAQTGNFTKVLEGV